MLARLAEIRNDPDGGLWETRAGWRLKIGRIDLRAGYLRSRLAAAIGLKSAVDHDGRPRGWRANVGRLAVVCERSRPDRHTTIRVGRLRVGVETSFRPFDRFRSGQFAVWISLADPDNRPAGVPEHMRNGRSLASFRLTGRYECRGGIVARLAVLGGAGTQYHRAGWPAGRTIHLRIGPSGLPAYCERSRAGWRIWQLLANRGREYGYYGPRIGRTDGYRPLAPIVGITGNANR